ncbi:MAG: hypothetical protein ACRCVX_00105, partial [Shewanella sp.]
YLISLGENYLVQQRNRLLSHPLLNLQSACSSEGFQMTVGVGRLSTVREVTVRDRDVTVEHTGMCLLRVTEMTVLNR